MIGSIWHYAELFLASFYGAEHLVTATFVHPKSTQNRKGKNFSFIIFWLISYPFLLLQPEQYRLSSIISSVIVIIAALSVFIWAVIKQGNGGPLISNPNTVWGAKGGGVRLGDDAHDHQWDRQIFIIPVCLLGINVLRIVTTSCTHGFYPDEPLLWKLYDLLQVIQEHSGPRACVAMFFMVFAFFVSQLSVNVTACDIVEGIDLAVLLPRYINIKQDTFIIVIIGICINPWKILNTHQKKHIPYIGIPLSPPPAACPPLGGRGLSAKLKFG
ncbi:hypothetical protein ARMGADRAFT_1030945 [Armillaria gallica]|uniref:Uncharacterized protein n=1 Tax=Armillaria gallica TaxID=47427 RepID=A0A2H3DBW9_ARMGA|nr:hypothetical protein ARMGADRAFT_1030945 [Armillaria gallica]